MQPTMKKRILLRLGILAALAACGFVLLVWWMGPSNLIDAEKFVLIEGGMTEAEVVEALGAPATSDSILARPNRKLFDVEALSFGAADASGGFKEWRAHDGRRIGVGFDKTGKATLRMRFSVRETWPDKIRRWLRLP